MYHFFVDEGQINEDTITIEGTDVNHIKNVLRMKEKDKLLISNGTDKDFLCEILSISSQSVLCKIIDVDLEGTELPSKIYLFQGLPKSDKMELIIQKAVELGVHEIIPVDTKRSVVKLDEKKAENKIKRWQQISLSAAKQSKRIIIPNIHKIMSFKEALEYASGFEYNLIPYENAKDMEDTKKAIEAIKPHTSIGIFIGPEGGFDEAEISLAISNGVLPVTLGKRILRTETAGIAALSVIMFHLEK